MRKVLIGSQAIQHWFPDHNRKPKDIDYAVDVDNVISEKGIEFLYNPVIFEVTNNEIATPEILLALKTSHLFWNTNWKKHMWDVWFLKNKGVTLDFEMYKKFRNFFESYLPTVHRSMLDQDKESFFSNAVNEDVDEHDDFHYMIADNPAFLDILKDGKEVEVCEVKFNNLPFERKMDVVIEEAVVMAYERYNKRLPFYAGFVRQLEDNIQKHYPEFIALFAIDQYVDLLDLRKHRIEEMFNKLNYRYEFR